MFKRYHELKLYCFSLWMYPLFLLRSDILELLQVPSSEFMSTVSLQGIFYCNLYIMNITNKRDWLQVTIIFHRSNYKLLVTNV